MRLATNAVANARRLSKGQRPLDVVKLAELVHADTYSIAHVSLHCQLPVDEDTEIPYLYYRRD